MNDQNKTPEEDLSIDEIYEIFFSLGALFGNTLERFGRENYKITFPGDEDHDSWFPPEDIGATPEDEEPKESPVHELEVPKRINESSSISAHIAQILTLLNPKVKAVFGSSAIYDILDEAVSAYGREGKTLEEKINGMPFHEACTAWIGTKRVFAVNHHHEVQQMLDLLIDNWNGFPEGLTAHFTGITETDRQNIRDYCSVILATPNPNRENTGENDSQLPESPISKITQLLASDNIFIPAAEAFRVQDKFALAASKRELGVGGGAKVYAKISSPEGTPIVLTAFDMQIEATIGELFQKNGCKSLTLTPAQIYKAFAKLDPDATVSPDKIAQTIAAMDKLLTTPATLDFAEQIEKHTKMKKQKDFDYTNNVRVGTLITGVHDQKSSKTYNGMTVKDSFTIHELPMFYAYSYAVGQMYTIQAKYLTGVEPSDPEAMKKLPGKKVTGPMPERVSIDDDVLHRWLVWYIEYQKSEKTKRNNKLRYKGQPIPDTFEFYLPFDTVEKEGLRKKLTEKTRRTLRSKVYDFLEVQVRMGNIKYREYYKKGRALHGVKVRI